MNLLFGHAMNDANELHFESIEQHVAVHTLDALERIANALEKEPERETQGIQGEQALTYHDFFKDFNAIARGCHACAFFHNEVPIGVIIVSDPDGDWRDPWASLGIESLTWNFNKSAFDYGELALMVKLAATPPKLRGGIDKEVNNAD